MAELIAAGTAAPPFSLVDQDDKPLTSSEFAGRPLVVFFYPKDDTSGCTAEAVAFSALADAFRDAGTALLGVSPDPPKSHQKFRAKHAITLRLGSDVDRTMCSDFGVWVEKSMYGRRYMGVERTTVLVAADGVVARVWSKVKVAGHAAEVLAEVHARGGAGVAGDAAHAGRAAPGGEAN